MPDTPVVAAEGTAARVALWRALHVRVDAAPHIIEDEIGLRLLDPPEDWQRRPDMDPQGTRRTRASILARARLIEDLVADEVDRVDQYVILGAGLDTFAQRRPAIASRLTIFEVDQPGPQAWKQQRLRELGYGIPSWLRFAPVDFETDSWRDRLLDNGFDAASPTIVASSGVTMYLTREANAATLRQIATLPAGSTLVTTFMVPPDLLDPVDRRHQQITLDAARASGTPFISFFTPDQIAALAEESGFARTRHVSPDDLADRYFGDRTDDLRPSTAEHILIATTSPRRRVPGRP